MLRKDLGLLVLILVVGAVVALINPRFLSPINLANTANLIGLFGIFSLGEGLVIITGGIDLSIGSVFALLGVIFVDLLVTYELPWPLAVLIILVAGPVVGLINGFLITRMRLQPFVVTLCGLLLYRGIARYYTNDGTAGFAFGQSFPTLEWLTTGRTLACRIPSSRSSLSRLPWRCCCTARCSAAICSRSDAMRKPRAIPASRPVASWPRPM